MSNSIIARREPVPTRPATRAVAACRISLSALAAVMEEELSKIKIMSIPEPQVPLKSGLRRIGGSFRGRSVAL